MEEEDDVLSHFILEKIDDISHNTNNTVLALQIHFFPYQTVLFNLSLFM